MKNLFMTFGSLALVAAAVACGDDDSSKPVITNDSGVTDTGTNTDGGTSDTGTTTPTFTHAAFCLTNLAQGNPAGAHRFAVKATSGGTTAAPTMTFDLTPIKVKAAGQPDTLSTSNTVGSKITLPNVAIGADGSFQFKAPEGVTTAIPGEANPLSGQNIVLKSLDLKGKVAAAPTFCGNFTAVGVEPGTIKDQPLSANCIFAKLNDGDTLPSFKKDEFDACAPAK